MNAESILKQIDRLIKDYQEESNKRSVNAASTKRSTEISDIISNLSDNVAHLEIRGFILNLKMIRSEVELMTKLQAIDEKYKN